MDTCFSFPIFFLDKHHVKKDHTTNLVSNSLPDKFVLSIALIGDVYVHRISLASHDIECSTLDYQFGSRPSQIRPKAL